MHSLMVTVAIAVGISLLCTAGGAAGKQVALLSAQADSFAFRTGDYLVSYGPGAKGEGWVVIRREGMKEPAIATKLANGMDLNVTDPGAKTIYRWTEDRKDSRILREVKAQETPEAVEVRFSSERRWAKFESRLLAYKKYPGLLHWTVEATAKAEKTFNVDPEPDCHFMVGSKVQEPGKRFDQVEHATHEVVRYMTQRATAAGIAYFRDIPMASHVFYFEDYSSLNDLYRLTGWANPFEYPAEGQPGAVRMGKPWSDFQLCGDGETMTPPRRFEHRVESLTRFGYERPHGLRIPKGTRLVLADTYLYLRPTSNPDNIQVCKDFVEMLSHVYQFIYKPPMIDTDWAGTVVPQMIRDILRKENFDLSDGQQPAGESPEVIPELPGITRIAKNGKHLLLHSYVNDDRYGGGLWAIQQLLHPLMEYVRKYPEQKEVSDFTRRLEASLSLFYDKKYQGFLNTPAPLDTKKFFHTVYVFNPAVMMADLALLGSKSAREMIMGYRERLLLMGRKCNYVFADVWLEDYSKQSFYYQFDETGAYIYVMMALYELSGSKDKECLESAKTAAEKLTERCLDLGWEVNMTASGAVGCEKLYRATGDKRYRDIAYIPLANTLRQAWLWECDYGVGEKITTFWAFCGTPAAPSSAEYETHRTRLHLKQYQELAKQDLSPELDLLVGDGWRRGPTQSRFALPPYLVEAGASKYVAAEGPMETDCGEIRYDQMIPLEDFRVGWGTDLEWWHNNAKQGIVGQEIYGAGGPIWYAVWQHQINGHGGGGGSGNGGRSEPGKQ